MRYEDIPRFPVAHYEIDVPWRYLEDHIAIELPNGLDLDPDCQRDHVWTGDQQRAYVEYVLQGGEVARQLIFNCPAWPSGDRGYVLVDGKQRLEAVRRFLRDDLEVFGGHRRSDIKGSLHPLIASFRCRVVSLSTKAEVLRLYLNINAGGTPHTQEELERVRRMLSELEAK